MLNNYKTIIYFKDLLPVIVLLLFIGSSNSISSQNNPYELDRFIVLNTKYDTTVTWSETILPESIQWQYKNSPVNIQYTFNDNTVTPQWSQSVLPGDSVELHFKVLPYSFHRQINLYDTSQIRIVEGDIFYHPIDRKSQEDLFASPGLLYDGALTRGFSMGNNQSLVFDSELNLQLSGNIGDGYQIKAAITDNNLPIQPDGTTRQLKEFDKVFIEIIKDQHSILAGDFDALQPAGYFMRYNRKLKGAQYTFLQNETPFIKIKGSAAVSRGKFVRQAIIPNEGNQGPYPLHGENGELFIVILAGSEKVFLDGRLLIRGEDADYIMDYNQSEISFTKNILINSRHRIIIEFEYAQFNFQKSHNAFELQYQKGKLNSFLHFFQENDSKTITGDLALTEEDLNFLQMAGDPQEPFYKSGIRRATEGYNTNAIFYIMKDTLVEGVLYENILVWTTHQQPDLFTVSFTEVGFGLGDYIISPNPSPNGRVYEWISPDPVTGAKRGNSAPLLPLQAPQQRQMITSGIGYTSNQGMVVTVEVGLSRQDLNRYSVLGDQDNVGAAAKINIANPFSLGKSWTIMPFISYEGKTDFFIPIDPYRNPEFTRDWNIQSNALRQKEHLPSSGFRLGKNNKFFTQYRYDGLFSAGYQGNRHTGQIHIDTSGWKVEALLSLLNAQDQFNVTKFHRPTIVVEKLLLKSGKWWIGSSFFEDKQEVRTFDTDQLLTTSFVQNRMSVYIKNDPENKTGFQLSYNHERPKAVVDEVFQTSEKTSEWNLAGHFREWKSLAVEYTIKHRDVQPQLVQGNARSQNLLGRIDVRSDFLNKAFKWSGGYEIGSGQEPKTEYKYIRVQKGEGFYVWIDDGDGVEELNEFEQAPFPDEGEYLKLSVFNSEFIRTRALLLQQTLNIDLKLLQPTGILSKMAILSNYQLTRKVREDRDSPYWNPFYQSYPDTSILAYQSTLRNIFYWNRSNTRYDIQVGHLIQKNQLLQTSGFDIRSTEDLTLRTRVSIQKKIDVVMNGRRGLKENLSQFFETRNYRIAQFELGPELNIILKEKVRLTTSYQYLFQENQTGPEEFESSRFSFEGVWRRSSTLDVRGNLSLVNIQYTSLGNLNVDFAMLQGLQNGVNFLWSLQFNTRLNKSLVLTIQYNGRDTGTSKTVHTGSAQVRANF